VKPRNRRTWPAIRNPGNLRDWRVKERWLKKIRRKARNARKLSAERLYEKFTPSWIVIAAARAERTPSEKAPKARSGKRAIGDASRLSALSTVYDPIIRQYEEAVRMKYPEYPNAIKDADLVISAAKREEESRRRPAPAKANPS